MKCIKKAKNLDIFGQKISFNFNKEGEEYNSPIGTIVSMIIILIVLVYSGVRLEVLILKSESNISSVSQSVDIDNDIGNIYLNETNMLFILSLYKSSDSMANINISKYLNVTF